MKTNYDYDERFPNRRYRERFESGWERIFNSSTTGDSLMNLVRGLNDEDERFKEPTLDQVEEGPLDDDDDDEELDDGELDDGEDDDFFEDDDDESEDDDDEPVSSDYKPINE